MTTFKPGQSPPHVTIAALISWASKYTYDLAPALKNFKLDSNSKVSV